LNDTEVRRLFDVSRRRFLVALGVFGTGSLGALRRRRRGDAPSDGAASDSGGAPPATGHTSDFFSTEPAPDGDGW
jgi:hypothetical protein